MSELKKDTVAENTAEVKTKTDDDKAAKTDLIKIISMLQRQRLRLNLLQMFM